MRGPIDRIGRGLEARVPFAVLVCALVGLALALPPALVFALQPATAADGSGTMTAVIVTGTGPTEQQAWVAPNSPGKAYTFTYTAPSGIEGIEGGELTIRVPMGWSEPSVTNTAPGYTLLSKTCGSNAAVSVSGSTIHVTELSIPASGKCTLEYGAKGSPGANAPTTEGLYPFAIEEKSSPSGTLKALAESPEIYVGTVSQKGTGTVSVTGPTLIAVETPGITLGFTFTGAMIHGGTISVAVPSSWSEPSTKPSAEGYATASCGTVVLSGRTIQVPNLTLTASEKCTIEYGVKTGGGKGANAGPESTTTTEIFTVSEKPVAAPGELIQAIAESPKIRVSSRTLAVAINGKGTVTTTGINCSEGECRQRYIFGTMLSLSASPAAGYTFGGWGGEACHGTSSCTVSLSGEAKEVLVTADFKSNAGTTTTTGTGTTTTTTATGTGTTTGTTATGTGTTTATGTGTTTGATTATGTGTAATGATSTGVTTATGTGTTTTGLPNVPICSLKAPSSKVKMPKKHKHGSASLALVAECNQTVNVELQGEVTERVAKKHPKTHELHRVYGSLMTGASQTLTLKVPASLLKALTHQAKASAKFTLTATNTAGASDRVTAEIESLSA